jgi:hypothetical protein
LQKFIAKYESQIAGVVSGFDRLVFRGSLRKISYVWGMQGYLWAQQVLLKDFGNHVQQITERVKQAALRCMEAYGRPVQYLYSSSVNKEEVARAVAAKDHITQGPVCALTCVEPCLGFDVYRNRKTRQLDLVQRVRKCLFVYQYWQHPVLGWMNARIQTWFPFAIQICINGREWLARQLDAAGLQYQRQDNCFPWLADYRQAQQLMDQQLRTDWPALLNQVAAQLNPLHDDIFARFPLGYYWSTYQSEWASDIVFRRREDLERLYPLWIHHALTSFGSPEVMRFLGKKLTRQGQVPGQVTAQIVSDCRRRQEGVRIKHRYNNNSIKLYDKAYTSRGSVLRAEMTMENPEDFQVYRRREGHPEEALAWQRMRKGIADLHRRAQVSQKVNDRYLDALAQTDDRTTLNDLIGQLHRPATYQDKRVRAMRPFAPDDRSLLQAISQGQFTLNGFRNRDLQALLYDATAASSAESRRRSAAVSRKLRLLRAHHLIRKMPHSYRYQLTPLGRQIVTAVLAAGNAPINSFVAKAA